MHVFENSLHINTMRLERERSHLFLERVCTKKNECRLLHNTHYRLSSALSLAQLCIGMIS